MNGFERLQPGGGGPTPVPAQRTSGPAAPRREGPGATPPTVPFDVVRERPSTEDAYVLFDQDGIVPIDLDLSRIEARLRGDRPMVVDLDGYSSTEGDDAYNLNLSAHRATVVQALLTTLPEGSVVHLHAHGETRAFGDRPANRRVGIRAQESTVALTPPSTLPPGGLSRRPRLLPDLELRLDPSLVPPPPGTLPPVQDFRLRPPFSTEPPSLGPPSRTEPPPVQPIPPPISQPPPPLRGPTILDPRLFLFTPPPDLVDWGALRQTYVDHGAGLIDPRDARWAEEHTRRWYEIFRPQLGESLARTTANAATRSAIGRELAREGNTAADRVDNELRRQGLPTPIGGSVDLLDLYRRIRGRGGERR